MVFGHSSNEPRLTRRQVLAGAAGAAGYLAGGATLNAALAHADAHLSHGGVHNYRSRPDLHPPALDTSGGGVGPGYLLLGVKGEGGTQSGPLLVDDAGQPVWFRGLPESSWATNLRAQEYRGKPVLVWWEGYIIAPGFGVGEGLIFDESYREVGRIRAGNNRTIDLHEIVPYDLSPMGGPSNGHVRESIIQEVDVRSGRLLWEWRSLDHIGITESYLPMQDPYDYLHANSIQVDNDGNLLVSFRHAWTVHKINRRTGAVMWRLGGRRSDFAMGPGTQFTWQHHVRKITDGMMTVFDNGSDGVTNSEPVSRALILAVDAHHKTVRLVKAYRHPQGLRAGAMGSVQLLPDGHTVVGWGTAGHASEYGANDEYLWDLTTPSGRVSYRALRFTWSGRPHDPPAVSSTRARNGDRTLHVSWNGATGVAAWQLLLGSSASSLQPARRVRRSGFETSIPN